MSWLELPEDTGFGIDNLPLGVFLGGDGPVSGTAPESATPSSTCSA
ncbi:hypothetical protein [Blastococcus brunescens]|uniref:Uncharacterized protein n=1 Tax=Blastococcus brunescens TaxID=1564165 RepID=A0ABZ1B7G0_9ACTN|nr:hypothetical protein [Blastococcus sp. BMG 8361]WRL66674.1 hypothetical protein U6N30_15550 [Blastococcus sp. BMG 8361]